MRQIADSIIVNFLENTPLYSKFPLGIVSFGRYTVDKEIDLDERPFRYHCPNEGLLQTFKTKALKRYIGRVIDVNDNLSKDSLYNSRKEIFDYVVLIKGVCQSCGESIDFSVRVFSGKKISDNSNDREIYLQKIGQFPRLEIDPDSDIKRFLTKEDLEYYKKAMAGYNEGYGIAAYSYFRRIVENEIIRMAEFISEMEYEGSQNVALAVEKYRQNNQMSNLINALNKHIPVTLISNGDNLIKLLHDQLSVGLHGLGEEECLKKARSINTVMTIVIKILNSEKEQKKELKNAIKGLKAN